MDCSMPDSPVHHQLPELTQTHLHWVSDAIHPSHPVIPFSSNPQSFPALGSFQMSQLFASHGQSIGVSASASVLPMNVQDWFPLGWTGLISLQSKGLSRVSAHLSSLTNIYKLKFKTFRCREQMYGYQGVQGGGGMNWEIGINVYTLLILYIK